LLATNRINLNTRYKNTSPISLFIFPLSHGVNHLFQLILPAVLPSVTAELKLSYYSAGILAACFAVSYAALQVPIGYVSDRFGRRNIMVLGGLVYSVAIIASGFSTDFSQLAVAQVFAGIGGSSFHPVGLPLFSQLVDRQRLGRAMGFVQMGGAVGSLLSPLAAVFIASIFGWRYSFILLSPVGFITALLAWLYVKEPDPQVKLQQEKSGRVDYVLAALVTLFALLWLFGFRGVTAFLTLFAVKKFQVDLGYAAFLLSMLQVAGIFSGPLFGHLSDRFGRRGVLVMTVLLQGLLVYTLAFASLEALPLILVVFGCLAYGSIAVTDATVTSMDWGRALGTVFGFYITASFLSSAIVPPVMGYLVDTVSFEFAFGVIAIPTLLAVPLILLVLRKR